MTSLSKLPKDFIRYAIAALRSECSNSERATCRSSVEICRSGQLTHHFQHSLLRCRKPCLQHIADHQCARIDERVTRFTLFQFKLYQRTADRGIANELARLERAARSGSKGRWIKAWAAASPRCRDLVWHPAPPVIKLEFDENGRLIGFERAPILEEIVGIDEVLIGPRGAGALAAIVEARRNLAATNRDHRRGNKRNDAADALAAAIRSAVLDLSGRVGFTRNPVEDTYSGPLVELGAAVDAHFGTRICWRLTVAK